MELLIIQYTFAVFIGVFLFTLPFRVVLMIRDIPNTLGITNPKVWRWTNII